MFVHKNSNITFFIIANNDVKRKPFHRPLPGRRFLMAAVVPKTNLLWGDRAPPRRTINQDRDELNPREFGA